MRNTDINYNTNTHTSIPSSEDFKVKPFAIKKFVCCIFIEIWTHFGTQTDILSLQINFASI